MLCVFTYVHLRPRPNILRVHRLIVGHSHFDVDQRHSVCSRKLLGRRGPADRGRRALHSLSTFKSAVQEAHKDLIFFQECTANYNFDKWLRSMENKHEVGIKTRLLYQLRVENGVVMERSKPRMSEHVPFSEWRQVWPVEECYWPKSGPRKNMEPVMPSIDSHPESCPPQKWKNFDKVRKTLLPFYNDEWWGVKADDKHEMKMWFRKWGHSPQNTCPKPAAWPDFELTMPRLERRPPVVIMVPRPPPLIPAPYHPFAIPKPARRHGAVRRSRGRGARAQGRGRGARGRSRGRGVRGRGARGRGTYLNSVNNVSDTDTEDDIPLREWIVRHRDLGHIAGPRAQGHAV